MASLVEVAPGFITKISIRSSCEMVAGHSGGSAQYLSIIVVDLHKKSNKEQRCFDNNTIISKNNL
jgi:hypothetical protein